MQSYKDLMVYQKSYEHAKAIYAISSRFPREEQYGITSQIRRAATSIPLNIAEGYGKAETGKELLRFLRMARGSSAEMEVLLEFSRDFKYISESEYEAAITEPEAIGKMLTGLMQSIAARMH